MSSLRRGFVSSLALQVATSKDHVEADALLRAFVSSLALPEATAGRCRRDVGLELATSLQGKPLPPSNGVQAKLKALRDAMAAFLEALKGKVPPGDKATAEQFPADLRDATVVTSDGKKQTAPEFLDGNCSAKMADRGTSLHPNKCTENNLMPGQEIRLPPGIVNVEFQNMQQDGRVPVVGPPPRIIKWQLIAGLIANLQRVYTGTNPDDWMKVLIKGAFNPTRIGRINTDQAGHILPKAYGASQL